MYLWSYIKNSELALDPPSIRCGMLIKYVCACSRYAQKILCFAKQWVMCEQKVCRLIFTGSAEVSCSLSCALRRDNLDSSFDYYSEASTSGALQVVHFRQDSQRESRRYGFAVKLFRRVFAWQVFYNASIACDCWLELCQTSPSRVCASNCYFCATTCGMTSIDRRHPRCTFS